MEREEKKRNRVLDEKFARLETIYLAFYNN